MSEDYRVVVEEAPKQYIYVEEECEAEPTVIEVEPEPVAVEIEVPGPPGPRGPAGELVEGTGDLNHTHIQGAPTDDVTVVHGLGKRPSIRVIDTSGRDVVGDYEDIDEDTTRLMFSAPFSFVASFN
jgi:hypothetical protein